MNQPNSRLSTTHGHIADRKLYSVVHAGVCGCKCGELISKPVVGSGEGGGG